jgi:hypothetical protein
MKIIVALVVLIGALPVVAQSPQPRADIREAAIANVPTILGGMHHKIPNGGFAIADRPAPRAETTFGEFTEKYFGVVIAEELIRSYAANDAPSASWPSIRVSSIPVLPLGEFSSGGTSYDWDRLKAKYPALQRVVRVSSPAVDRLGTFAVVRYEIIGPEGPDWAGLQKFERKSNGSWKAGVAEIGTIRD